MKKEVGIGLGEEASFSHYSNGPAEAEAIASILKEYTIKLRDRCDEYVTLEQLSMRRSLFSYVTITVFLSLVAIIFFLSRDSSVFVGLRFAMQLSIQVVLIVSGMAIVGFVSYYSWYSRMQLKHKKLFLEFEIEMLARRVNKALRFSSQYSDNIQLPPSVALQRDLLRVDSETVLRYACEAVGLSIQSLRDSA